jgi:tetratricopeptide (TPR) repeat protein
MIQAGASEDSSPGHPPDLSPRKKTLMALDLYASCPCGSGKKFKWCCQPIHEDIDRAYRQDAEGQHEAALKIIADLVAEHPSNPEAWGRQAHLLYQNGQVEEAEKSLDKAFECNPNYPFGLFLRGLFRYHEGEIGGAALLFRKSAEAYDPQAKEALGQVYGMIADCELKLNRPVAARAAMRIAMRTYPADDNLRQGFEQVFGEGSAFPASARRDYVFRSPAPSVAGERRRAWDQALSAPDAGRLSTAIGAFDQLTQADEQDGAAWYNLGLARAWIGDNAKAIEALDRYVALEADEAAAGEAWTLAEVLRCGHGMEDQADYRDYSAAYQVRDPQALVGFLRHMEESRRLAGMQANEQEGILSGLIVEPLPVLTAGSAGGQMVAIQSYLMIIRDFLRIWFPKKESFEKTQAEVQQRLGAALSAPRERAGPANFGDVVIEALVLPAGPMPQEEATKRVTDHAQRYFEDTWIHRPLRALNRMPPIDAAGHSGLRKKLRGVVQFVQECASLGGRSMYDFDRLRLKLGLTADTSAPATAGEAVNINAMSAADLSALAVESLNDEQLESAYQAAQKLDAKDLAERFARTLISRPARPERPDRYPWFSFLVQRAVGEGKGDEALQLLNEGERFDAEQNQGQRASDYEFRRAQVWAKRGEAEQAASAFDRLIERDPANLRYRGDAAEAMLSLKQGPRALRFAEQGLAAARQQNNRDQEQYFLELTAAAEKQA